MKSDNRMSGFTMVEMVITLAIMGILTTLSVSYFQGLLPKYRFEGNVRTLASDLSLARLQSIAKNREYKVYLDKNNERYLVSEGDRSESSTCWGDACTPHLYEYQVQLSANTNLTTVSALTGDSAIFRPNGTLKEAGSLELEGAGQARQLRLDEFTGRITVFRKVNGVWTDERFLKG